MVYRPPGSRPCQYTGSTFTLFEKQFLGSRSALPLMWIAARMPGGHRALAYPLCCCRARAPGPGPRARAEVNGNRNWIAAGRSSCSPPSPPSSPSSCGAPTCWPARSSGSSRVAAPAGAAAAGRRCSCRWSCSAATSAPRSSCCDLPGAAVGGGRADPALRRRRGVVAGAGRAVLVVVEPYRMTRLDRFLDPSATAWATATRPSTGCTRWPRAAASAPGWGQGPEEVELPPEPHTDFIFAIIGEELGLVGTLSVLALFGLLAYAVSGRRRAKDPFVRLAAAGVTAWMVGQADRSTSVRCRRAARHRRPAPAGVYGGSALLPYPVRAWACCCRSRDASPAPRGAGRRGPVRPWGPKLARPGRGAGCRPGRPARRSVSAG